ncbi:hypothetical protein D3C71_1042030 [compost metagenome]
MRTDTILVQRHQHFLLGDAFHFHARHTRQTFQTLLDAAFDHVSARGQVFLAVEAQADRFLVTGTPALHVIAPEVIGQLVAYRIDALARFGRRHGDVATPITEFDLDLAALGVGARVHHLDAGHRGDGFFHRPQQVAFHFLRRRAGVRQRHEEERDGGFRLGFQRQPERGDQANHHHRHEQHDGGDRATDGQLSDVHPGQSFAPPIMSCSCASTCSAAAASRRARRPRSA